MKKNTTYKNAYEELKWNVFCFKNGQCQKVNIFEFSSNFNYRLSKADTTDFETFKKDLLDALLCYWGKVEYEMVITDFPPYVDNAEIDRLEYERTESLKKRDIFYRETVNIENAKKIDIYDQVIVNFDIFAQYTWEHKDLIKKGK